MCGLRFHHSPQNLQQPTFICQTDSAFMAGGWVGVWVSSYDTGFLQVSVTESTVSWANRSANRSMLVNIRKVVIHCKFIPKVTPSTRSSSPNIQRRLRKIFSTNDLNCDACHPVPAQSTLRTHTFFWLCWHNLGSPTSLLAKYVSLPNPQIPQSWKVTVLKSWRTCTMHLRGSVGRQNKSSAERPRSSIRLEAVQVW